MRLVLLPGLDGTGKLFQPLLKVLPPRSKPQVVSYPSEQFLSYKELVLLVGDALPRTEPFVLLGESYGGPLSIEIAALHPSNLRAVILCASFITNPLPPSLTWVAWLPQPLIALMGNLSPPDIFVRFIAAGMDSPRDLLDLFCQVKQKVSPRVIAQRVRALHEVDASEALKKCSVPILYLMAKQDRLVSPKCLDDIRNIKPTIQAIEVEAPHFILQRKPQEVSVAIDRFIEGLRGNEPMA